MYKMFIKKKNHKPFLSGGESPCPPSAATRTKSHYNNIHIHICVGNYSLITINI